jgi:hypothetical protein
MRQDGMMVLQRGNWVLEVVKVDKLGLYYGRFVKFVCSEMVCGLQRYGKGGGWQEKATSTRGLR